MPRACQYWICWKSSKGTGKCVFIWPVEFPTHAFLHLSGWSWVSPATSWFVLLAAKALRTNHCAPTLKGSDPTSWLFRAVAGKGCAWFPASPLLCYANYELSSDHFPCKTTARAHNFSSLGFSRIYCNIIISSSNCVTLWQTSLFCSFSGLTCPCLTHCPSLKCMFWSLYQVLFEDRAA